MTEKLTRQALLCTTMIVTGLIAATPARSQTTPPPESVGATASDSDSIVVTGSRIQRPDLTVASPVAVIGQEEIALRQPGTAEDLLRDLPSVRPATGPGANNGANGSSTVDLRGIGDNRTLVLLDGRRIVPYSLNGVTDLNTIPPGLIERVDVVTGGASSVYGADAVAGVVNFITRRNFSGVNLDSSYRITERGDTPQFRVNALFGANFDGGKGNAVLGLGYLKRQPLFAFDRSIGEIPRSSANGLFNGSQNTAPILFTSPSPTALGLGAGSLGSVLDPATGSLRIANQGDTYNSNDLSYYQTPLQRFSAYAAAHYEVADGVDLYSSAMFSRNEAVTSIAPSGTFQNIYQLPLSNAYLPTGVRNQLCNAIDTNPGVAGIQPLSAAQCAAAATAAPGSANYREIAILGQRRFVEFGPRVNAIDANQFQLQIGARGDVLSNLHYDVSAQYGETSQFNLYDGWGSNTRLQQAIRSYRNPAGTPTCNDPSFSCVPINLFGPAGTITPEMARFIDLDAQVRRKVQLTVVSGNIGGDLFGLTSPFAEKPLAFSVGAEYRKLVAIAQPDANLQIQNEVLGTGSPVTPDRGEITVKEAFGELIAPLVVKKPFFYNLQLEAGVRYSDYNTTGGSLTWKAGGSYEPFQGFKFRGMYQVAVRSPNISELYASPVQGLANRATDPCQGSLPVANPALAALCVATGASASTIGSIPTPSAGQVNTTTAGNANLDVERARTYTLGLVLTPPQVPRLSVTLDYFHIKIRDAISSPTVGNILDGCYSTALNPQLSFNQFCALIGRNPLTGGLNGTGETSGARLLTSNQGVIETAGLDLGVSYRFDLSDFGLKGDPGSLRLSFNGTYLDYYRFQASPVSINRDCTGYYSNDCGNPRARLKWNMRASYTLGPADLSLLWTHISRVRIEPFQATAITPLSTPQTGGPNPTATSFGTVIYNGVTYTNVPTNGIFEPYRQIKAFDYFDLSTTVHVNPNFEVGLLVDNLLDRDPPQAAGVGVNIPVIYDVLGRTYTISARIKF
ncbi:TonB-dependent receptor domain-containing protein [Sphingobium aquiterrae]|uniref:TonB-dependent receptor domain-containing protein n=1 Tax=Sphingobium aquiterrae TaxID=2038656 RepID=UPI003017BE64